MIPVGPEESQGRAGTQPVIAIDGPGGAGKSTTARAVAELIECRHLDSGALYRAVALGVIEMGVTAVGSVEKGGVEKRIVGRVSDDEVTADKRTAPFGAVPTPVAQAAEEIADRISLVALDDQPCFGVRFDGQPPSGSLRSPEVSRLASLLATLPGVRRGLTEAQRSTLELGPIVCDGRDMGTVIFPTAALKVFLVADVLERARRRHLELVGDPLVADDRELPPGIVEVGSSLVDELRVRDERDSRRVESPLRRAPDAHLIDTTRMTIEEQAQRIVELAVQAGFRRR